MKSPSPRGFFVSIFDTVEKGLESMRKNLPSDVRRSIYLTYAIAICHFSWFWLPIWVLFYRRFTDFAGVGILEALTAAVAGFGILPAGILSDRIGKQRTLFFAGVLSTIGAILTGFAATTIQVGIGVVVLSTGGTLYVSSMEALQYDTLKSKGFERYFPHVLSRSVLIRMVTCGLSSIIGGYLYTLDVRLPFFAVGISTAIGTVLSLWIREPPIDTQSIQILSLKHHLFLGLRSIFHGSLRSATLVLLAIGILLTADSSGFWDIQAVQYGLGGRELGILYTGVYATMAIVSLAYTKIAKRMSLGGFLFQTSLGFGISTLLSALVGGFFGSILLVVRSLFSILYDMRLSVFFNSHIPSRVRATTLSVISLIRGTPYILFAYTLGSMVDTVGAPPIALGLGSMMVLVALLVPILVQHVSLEPERGN